MKLGNEGIKLKFDDIDERVDFLIALCQSLQKENTALQTRISSLETELDQTSEATGQYAAQETLIHTKIDGLLAKLDGFSDQMSRDDLSKA